MAGELVHEPPWRPWSPEVLHARLAGVSFSWYVTAGWAVDLFLGEVTRPHSDVEIGIPSAHFDELQRLLSDLQFWVVGDGCRFVVSKKTLAEHFQTWGWSAPDDAYVLDVFRDPHEGESWLCRRDLDLRRPYADVIRHNGAGIPYEAPEIVMLFKAKHQRDKDERDWALVHPRLDDAAVAWLRGALSRLHPGQPWLDDLR
jgi:hypothetical protein